MYRPLLLVIIAAAIIVACYFQGWIELINSSDPTHIVWGQSGLFVVASFFAVWQKWKTVDWIADALLFIGLIGTVLGFVIALGGVNPEAATDIDQLKPMIANLLTGMGTALYTTLIGAVGCLYLKFVQHVCIHD